MMKLLIEEVLAGQKRIIDVITSIIDEYNSRGNGFIEITTNIDDDEPFIVFMDWNEVAFVQRELNRRMWPDAFYKNHIGYLNQYGNKAYRDMRYKVKNSYIIPSGLHELDEFIEWGFDDEYAMCSECRKAVALEPGYFGDIPYYYVVDGEFLCGDCIKNNEQLTENYIEEVIEGGSKANLDTRIVSEEKLKELGWINLGVTGTIEKLHTVKSQTQRCLWVKLTKDEEMTDNEQSN
jgi:hypothetical protein